MSYEAIGLFIAALSNGFLSLIVLRGRKDFVAVVFSLFALAASMWAFFLALFIGSENVSHALMYANSYYVAAAAIPVLLLIFSIYFEGKLKTKLTHQLVFISSLPWLLIILAFLFNKNLIVDRIEIEGGGSKAVSLNQFNYTGYAIYFAFYFITTYAVLLYKVFKTKNKRNRNRLILIASGILFSYLFGMYYNLFLPYKGNYELIWVGPLFSIFMIISVGIAIFRYKLFDIKILGTQLFVGVLLLFILTQTLISSTKEELLVNLALLIFSTFFSILLVRSVIKEVQAREHIEKLAKDLGRANAELQKVSALKSEFVSVATHQLRGPLTAIKGYSSMLLDGSYGEVPEKVKEPIDRIHTSTISLAQVVQDFLDVSRIEQGSMKYEMVAFNFADLVREVVGELEPTINASHLEFHCSVDGVEFNDNEIDLEKKNEYVLKGDRLKLKQVVSNLIDNAIKYTKEGSVSVGVAQNDREVNFFVEDTGVGIEPKVSRTLFQKFERAEGADQVNVSGTGLGLYIVKEIVEAHKGKVWVESEGLGRGSRFNMKLPK